MSRLIAFWSPSGAGATTLLLNTAAALSARGLRPVAADLNLTSPSLALCADVLPYDHPMEACLSRLLPVLEGGRLTLDELVRRLLPADGFSVLPGFLDAVAASRVTEAHVRQIIGLLQQRYGLVLADLTPALDSVACLPVLEAADRIILVTGPEIVSRFHTRRLVIPLKAMGWDTKTALVFNRAGGLPESQLSQDVDLPVAVAIPEWKGMAGLMEAGRIAYQSRIMPPVPGRFRAAVDRLAGVIAQGVS